MVERRGRTELARRPVYPQVIVTSGEAVAEIQQVRQRAASRVRDLQRDLADLEAALLGGAGPIGGRAERARPRLGFYHSRLSETLAVPQVTNGLATEQLLTLFGKIGLRDRSFDTVLPVTAPQPINDTGNYYDAGAIYDAWLLNPNIDTRIDFNKAPNQNTPSISANSRMQFQVRAQKVWYMSAVAGLTGTLQIWLLKFSGT